MFIRNDEDFYLSKELQNTGLSKVSAEFFLDVRKHFEVTDQIKTTTKKLAAQLMKSPRTINRYIKDLKEARLLHDRPIYNNDNPDKAYVEFRILTLTDRANYYIDRALENVKANKNKNKTQKNVYFNEVA